MCSNWLKLPAIQVLFFHFFVGHRQTCREFCAYDEKRVSKCLCCWVYKDYQCLPIRCWLIGSGNEVVGEQRWPDQACYNERVGYPPWNEMFEPGKKGLFDVVVWFYGYFIAWIFVACYSKDSFITPCYVMTPYHTQQSLVMFFKSILRLCVIDIGLLIFSSLNHVNQEHKSTPSHAGWRCILKFMAAATALLAQWYAYLRMWEACPSENKKHTESQSNIPDLSSILNPCYRIHQLKNGPLPIWAEDIYRSSRIHELRPRGCQVHVTFWHSPFAVFLPRTPRPCGMVWWDLWIQLDNVQTFETQNQDR